ncbi:MAG: fatty acid desaturase [Coxiellaceae bacterium]|nr:fatty acid desaturase [Coxiellaceae bacterium]
MSLLKRINWVNLIFLSLVPIVGIAGTIWLAVDHQMHWQTWTMAGIYTYISGVAITAGYHRLFSHRAYKGNWIVRFIAALMGGSVFQGSVLEWCTDHRNHHLYTDTDRDPYSIKKGFWHAHMGWLFVLDNEKRDFSNVEDLKADRMLSIMHTFYVPIAILSGFVLPTVIAGVFWGDWWGGLIIGGALRIAFNEQVTFCINSICHVFGKKTYSDKQTACDNWITALVTYGEGFHNFHHQFPLDYRNGVRFFHYDPAKWLIRAMQWMGCAKDLRRVSDQKIIQYRMRQEESRLLASKAAQSSTFMEQLSELVLPLKDKVMEVSKHIEDLEKQLADVTTKYKQLKTASIDFTKDKVEEYKASIADYHQRIKQANKELKHTLNLWSHMVKTYRLKRIPVSA